MYTDPPKPKNCTLAALFLGCPKMLSGCSSDSQPLKDPEADGPHVVTCCSWKSYRTLCTEEEMGSDWAL